MVFMPGCGPFSGDRVHRILLVPYENTVYPEEKLHFGQGWESTCCSFKGLGVS